MAIHSPGGTSGGASGTARRRNDIVAELDEALVMMRKARDI